MLKNRGFVKNNIKCISILEVDFRLKCLGCGHQVMVPRKLVEKNTRGLTKKE